MLSLNKKIVALASALIISTTSSVALAYTPLDKDYHTATTREELEDLYNSNDEFNTKVNLKRSSFLKNKIQAPLVRHNPNKLKIAQNKYTDGLQDVYIKNTGKDIDIAGRSLSGYIYLTSGLLNSISGNYDDYNIYGISAIAFMYAHETGHWYYNDGWSTNEQEVDFRITYKMEQRADKFALKTIENVPQFSVGGEMIFAYYSALRTGWNNIDVEHPTNLKRFETAYNYIIESSNERVVIDNFDDKSKASNELLIADKTKSAYYTAYTNDQIINGKKVASASDRAYYVAGQVAWAIKNNCWDSKHITFEDAHKYFNDLPADVKATAIIARKGNQYKIIDWYQNDKAETTEKQYLDNLKASYQN